MNYSPNKPARPCLMLKNNKPTHMTRSSLLNNTFDFITSKNTVCAHTNPFQISFEIKSAVQGIKWAMKPDAAVKTQHTTIMAMNIKIQPIGDSDGSS